MSHPSSAQSFSTTESPLCPILRSRHGRPRTLSLLSISSAASVQSLHEITKGETLIHNSENHEAWGSFIPLRSATTSLREFISVSSSRSFPERRRTSSHDIESPYWEDPKSSSPKPKVPYITRTLSTSPVRPPSPISLSSSHHVRSDLHPILAQVEGKSRLCTQRVYCSTCRKAGTDFPRCGKCGETWCSRTCRLVGGKRHLCNGSRK